MVKVVPPPPTGTVLAERTQMDSLAGLEQVSLTAWWTNGSRCGGRGAQAGPVTGLGQVVFLVFGAGGPRCVGECQCLPGFASGYSLLRR